MLRDIAAGIAGIIIAIAIVFLADKLSHMMYPMPAGLDIGAYLTVMAGWVVATFVGAIVAGKIGAARAWVYPTIVGGFVFTAATFNLISVPHPHWFTAASLIAILVSAWLAWFVAKSS